jgi:hypothetical protein
MCGNNLQGISENARFCPKCGASIGSVQAPKAEHVYVPQAQTPQDYTNNQSSTVTPPVSAPASTAAIPLTNKVHAMSSSVNPLAEKSGGLQGIELAELKPVDFGGLKWRVIKYNAEEDTMLLLSETVIDKMPFQALDEAHTWEESSLRAYLNGDFLKRFTEEEQTFIIPTWIENKEEKFTEDEVFLLSVNEAKEAETVIDLRVRASTYWLRTKGMQGTRAYVSSGGGIAEMGYDSANYMGVRPAMWIAASYNGLNTMLREMSAAAEEQNRIHEYVASMESLIESNKKEILRLRASGDHAAADTLFTKTKAKEDELAYLRTDAESSATNSSLTQSSSEIMSVSAGSSSQSGSETGKLVSGTDKVISGAVRVYGAILIGAGIIGGIMLMVEGQIAGGLIGGALTSLYGVYLLRGGSWVIY